jgi:hypothetical protein
MGWTAEGSEFDSGQWREIFLFCTESRSALFPTQSPIKWVLGTISLGVKQLGGEAHLHLVAKLRICGAIPSLPYKSSWRCVQLSTGELHVYLILLKVFISIFGAGEVIPGWQCVHKRILFWGTDLIQDLVRDPSAQSSYTLFVMTTERK